MHALNIAEVVLRNKRPHVSGRCKSPMQASFYCATHSTVAASRDAKKPSRSRGDGANAKKEQNKMLIMKRF